MRILFITSALDNFKIYKDTTYAIMSEAARRGYQLFFCEPKHLAFESGIVKARIQAFEIISRPDDIAQWYQVSCSCTEPLTYFNAVLVRADPPFDIEYVTSTWLLEIAERAGVKIFNKPQAIRNHSEKLAISEFPNLIVPTLVTRDESRLYAFYEEHRDVVFKPLDSMGGTGIFYVGKDAVNLNVIIEQLGKSGERSIMAQRFIPEIREGDKRILLIDGNIVPYALSRIPRDGEIRGNLAVGGLGKAQVLSRRDLEIAEALGLIMKERGLLLVGLDIIGDWLTEVNVTSPTCFREIMDQTGFDVAAMFINALESHIA